MFEFFKKKKTIPHKSHKIESLIHDIEDSHHRFLSLFSSIRNRRGMQYEFEDWRVIIVWESNRSLITIWLATAIAKANLEYEKERVRSALWFLSQAIQETWSPIEAELPEKAKKLLPFKINIKSFIICYRAIKKLTSTDPEIKISLEDISEYFYLILKKNSF